MKRCKSSSNYLSPFKKSDILFRFQQPFANFVNATPAGSRSSTPIKKKIDFYNFKQIIHVKDELQEKHQTDSIADNVTTNFATPRDNHSLLASNKRSQSVSKVNKTQIFQFLSPQTSRTTSPSKNIKSESLFQMKTDLMKKTKKLKQDIHIYNFLKKDENMTLKNIKNTQDPLVKTYQAENHDKQDLIQNLKDKEKQFNRQKMFLIDKIQQKRLKNEREEREKLYIQMAKQQLIKNYEELQKDKILADQIITNSFRKFTGSVNLYNLYFTPALDEPEGFRNKKSMKVQTCLLLPQKLNNLQESTTSPNTALSRKNSSHNNNSLPNNSEILLLKKHSSIYKQDRHSNPPSTRSQNTSNIATIKRQSSKNAEISTQSPTKKNFSQIQQAQLIQNAIDSLQRIKNTTQENNIFSNNQTERNHHNVKGVLKQKYSDLGIQFKRMDQHTNFQDKKGDDKIPQSTIKLNIQQTKQYTLQNLQPKEQNFFQNIIQNNQQSQQISFNQQQNTQQYQVPPILQLQLQEQANSIIDKSDSVIQKSPNLSIKKERNSFSKSQQQKQRKIQLIQNDENLRIDPIDKLDAMSENFTTKLLQLKEYEIDEDFFSPVHDKYKLQISQIQSPKAKDQDKYFVNIRHNKMKEVAEDLEANPELIFSVDNYLYTGLHWAVKRNYEDLAKFLVSKGSNLFSKDYKNRTPYELAVELGYFNITKIINQ
ncbi:ankyrin repeat protein (macronuclear) [Tetrahymena thermophila SB210]|uniref:Ankyrin repeat protein n=1 Tax=Tetrahymena thermophila (strain SB210) TaxID=312017 RepID=Q22R95_TETTS|nr:ankyrin repeat protein [Tetrahymena thermophila SB210]EAR88227.1 ankyrin repeat protein [Tetrahymena thermophila SB210]|eukprot:XP_001008472.1 ankyrin repeat protein [Tetrahymena thermophila SB210]